MYLQKLSLVNFKNFEEFDFEPSERINCFIGDNGIGKTNLLDSIHYLSFCKSFLNPIDRNNIKYDNDFFIIDGKFLRENKVESVYCGVKIGKNKSFRLNGSEYSKLSDHIGFIPLIYSTPTDIHLIISGSEVRRKFVDSIISQFDKSYLQDIIAYSKALEHRNKLLKSFSESGSFDYDSIEAWDLQLVGYGNKIYNKRKVFSEEIVEIFQKYYKIISDNNETVSFNYKSQLKDSEFEVLLKNNLNRDRAFNYTTVGVHKDDFEFLINGHSVKKYASQGQQKSYIMSLKFAQFDYIKTHTKLTPVLLLDDIFDKLDKKRVVQIAGLVSNNEFGQIFITDTSYNRMPNILSDINIDNKILNLSKIN